MNNPEVNRHQTSHDIAGKAKLEGLRSKDFDEMTAQEVLDFYTRIPSDRAVDLDKEREYQLAKAVVDISRSMSMAQPNDPDLISSSIRWRDELVKKMKPTQTLILEGQPAVVSELPKKVVEEAESVLKELKFHIDQYAS